jgi:hypothetical protein
VTGVGELGIRSAGVELAAHRQGVADDQEFHCTIDKQK